MKINLPPLILFLFLTICTVPVLSQDSSYVNSIGMEFVRIKPGSFVMGKFDPPFPKPSDSVPGYTPLHYQRAEERAKQDTRPGFTVSLPNAYYIGKYEVTQAQWERVMGYNPSVFNRGKVGDSADLHPVENVSWKEVQAFVKKLNALEGGRFRYRLPTEAEWEYAARAGAQGDIPWAEIRQTTQMGTRTTQLVGQKKPNAWGLYDMLGNVWEWVQEVYNEKMFADPVPPRRGAQHVLKGASFVGDVKNATYATHAAGPANGWDVGFRVVMEVRK